jgi:hypothetical protein
MIRKASWHRLRISLACSVEKENLCLWSWTESKYTASSIPLIWPGEDLVMVKLIVARQAYPCFGLADRTLVVFYYIHSYPLRHLTFRLFDDDVAAVTAVADIVAVVVVVVVVVVDDPVLMLSMVYADSYYKDCD